MKLQFSKYIVTYSAIIVLICLNVLLFFFWQNNEITSPANIDGRYTEIDQIKGQNLDFKQLSVFFTKLADDKGGEYGYKALTKAAALNYLPSYIDLHLLGHVVGDILYKQKGIEGITICTNDLRNACSHSIVVGLFLEKGIEVLPEVAAVCKKAPGGTGAYTMCVHGLGHGVLAFENYNMEKAIELCKKTNSSQSGNAENIQCVGGVTMEMMSGINDPEVWAKQKDKYFKKDDPLSPCDQSFIADNVKQMCYTYLTPHLLEAAGANLANPDPKYYEKAFSFCGKIPASRKSDREACFGGFGKEFVVLANARNIQSITDMSDDNLEKSYSWCRMAGITDGINACLSQALQSLFWGGENDTKVSINFCSIMDDRESQDFCFSTLINLVAYYKNDGEYRDQFCGQLTKEPQAICKKRLIKT